MKKLLLICVIVLGIVFVGGCIEGEKATTSTVTDDSQSSGNLLNPSNLLKGYYSSNYITCAISKAESFEIRPNFSPYDVCSDKNLYENDIPAGKKRVATRFNLANEDNTIQMQVMIFESDSNSKLKEFISQMEEDQPSIRNDKRNVTRGSVGDFSFQYSIGYIGEYSEYTREYSGWASSMIWFSVKNRVVSLKAGSLRKGVSQEKIQTETLKVAKAIKDKID